MKASMINFSYLHLLFSFFHHRNAICTVPTILCYALNKRTHIHIIVLDKIILIYTLHQDNLTIVFSFSTQNTRHHFFLILHIALKILTSTASSATMTQLPKCIYSVPSQRPSMMKNQDPSLSRMNLSNLLKYPYKNSFTILNIIIKSITSSKTHLTSSQ